MDWNHDGIVTVEDFIRVFSEVSDSKHLFKDLQKLLKDKDTKGIGHLNYNDFSNWVAHSIHEPEAFYFRHDSKENPQTGKNQSAQEKKLEICESIKIQMNKKIDLKKVIFEKIRT